jgi:predicted regulator of Ras-like GTPase activity (Roadblock/LC7/MglB family)
MRELLSELNETAGIRGSMIVTRDGMIVASLLGKGLDEEKVAAMVSSLVVSTLKLMAARDLGDFTRLTLNATHGKLIFTDTGAAYLVVVLEKDIDLGPAAIEIRSAARRIREATKIGSMSE